MARCESVSYDELLEALAMAGFGAVQGHSGDTELVSRDQQARNHALPIGVGEARHGRRCTADSVLPRELGGIRCD